MSMRDNYLDWISKYRAMGYRIYFQDETWVFKNMACSKAWKDIQSGCTNGLYAVPSGRGERSIVCHVESAETGLLDNCLLMFRGSKSNKSSDYHSEMNWDVFSHWCDSKVFPGMKCVGYKSCLVLDRATYHTVLDEEDRRPVTSWSKTKLCNAIERWGGCDDGWPLTWKKKKTLQELLDYARKIYPSPKYKIQKIADKYEEGDFKIVVLFLPVAHPELNPIEMVWGQIKRKVASKNMDFKLSSVEELTRTEIAKVSPCGFARYVSHTIIEEEKYKQLSTSDIE